MAENSQRLLEDLASANALIYQNALALLATVPPDDERHATIVNMVEHSRAAHEEARANVEARVALADKQQPCAPTPSHVQNPLCSRGRHVGQDGAAAAQPVATPRPEGSTDAAATSTLFWMFIGLTAPLLAAILTFAFATTNGHVLVSGAVCIHVLAAILILAVPAASAPNGPPPEMQGFVNFVFASITAVAFHAVRFKWQETEHDGATSQLVRRGLVVSLALVISASALVLWAFGAGSFWRVCRCCAVLSGLLRLAAILLLYRDGATSYPPGALPFGAAVTAVCVLPIVACLATPRARQRLARATGIAQRIRALQLKTPRWLPS